MADYDTIESLHSLDSSLNNHQTRGKIDIQLPDFSNVEVEEKKNDDDETTLHPDIHDQQPMPDAPTGPRASGATQVQTNRSYDLLTLPPLGHENSLKAVANEQPAGPRASGATQVRTNRSDDWKPVFQKQSQQDHNSVRDNATLDSDSIYTDGNQHGNNNSTTLSTSMDVEAKSTPSKHSAETTKGGTDTLTPSVATPSASAPAEEEVGSYMSIEVIEQPNIANDNTPKIGYGHKTTTADSHQSSAGPIIQVVEHNNNNSSNTAMDEKIQHMVNAQMNTQEVPTREIVRQLSNVVPKEAMTPPNMVTLKNNKNEPPQSSPNNDKTSPFQEAGSAASTDGSLYTAGHDASTITKDTFLKQQDFNYLEAERQAYATPIAASTMIDPEAPQQEATPDYDAYFDPNAYGPAFSHEGDEPSIGHSTITSLTKDTGILRTEQPDDLPVSRGIMVGGEDVSDLSPARGFRTQHKPGTPSTFESGVLKDEEYGSGNGNGTGNGYNNRNPKDEPGSMWIFLQNATRDPTVQCLISLACIFAVILFFLVAVIIVLTSEDIQI